jgi:hypothetical protein
VQDDAASTGACCDQWEDAHALGVKYSGTWNDLVRACFICKVRCYKIINASESRSARTPMVSSASPVGMIVASAKGCSLVLAVRSQYSLYP